MKFSSFLTACICAAFVLSLGGCAENAQTGAPTLSQKQAARQIPAYAPSYRPNGASAPQGNVISSSPFASMTPAPVPAAAAVKMAAKIKAAILLPLSGKNAALGQAMLNAAQQAVFDSAGTDFELQPRDTAGGADMAAHAAIIGGAQIIIGPLFAADVPAVKSVALSGGLPMLPLSTDTSLAEPGVFVMGLAPGPQVERVVAYAAAHHARRFAALLPATPYGSLVGRAFADAVARQGGAVVAYETFDPAAHESDARVKILAGQRDSIDALFLPESGSDLKEIADQLAAAGFDPAHTHILGTGLWDVPGLGRQSPLLPGGWYAAPDPEARRLFTANYLAAYGQEPPRLATLAYDATALAAVLAKRGGRYDDAALTNPNGFAGLDGIFRLLPTGEVERGLAVNEVTMDNAKVIDPSPASFVAPKK